jgi:hypothetical protein
VNLREQPWWTAADAAELDVLVHELVAAVEQHRETGCRTCAAGYPPCPGVQAAITVAIEWRETRILRSRARWERSRQDRLDKVMEEAAAGER